MDQNYLNRVAFWRDQVVGCVLPYLRKVRISTVAYVFGSLFLLTTLPFFIRNIYSGVGSKVSFFYWNEFQQHFDAESRHFDSVVFESKDKRMSRLIRVWLLGPDGLHLQKKGSASLVLLGSFINGSRLVLDFDQNLFDIWNDGDIKLFLEGLAQTVSADMPNLKSILILCEGLPVPHISSEVDLGSPIPIKALTLKGTGYPQSTPQK